MKDLYRKPELEIVFFEDMDVIATSNSDILDEDELPVLPIG